MLLLTTLRSEAMNQASISKRCVDVLESILLSNISSIAEAE